MGGEERSADGGSHKGSADTGDGVSRSSRVSSKIVRPASQNPRLAALQADVVLGPPRSRRVVDVDAVRGPDGGEMAMHPAALKPVWRARGGAGKDKNKYEVADALAQVEGGETVRGKYSAGTREDLDKYKDFRLKSQGRLVYEENEGIVLVAGTDTNRKDPGEAQKSKKKIRHILNQDYGKALLMFRRKDAYRDGTVSRADFRAVLKDMSAGLTENQTMDVITELNRVSEAKGETVKHTEGEISYMNFLDHYGGRKASNKASDRAAKLGGKPPSFLKTPPVVVPPKQKGLPPDKTGPKVVFWLGFCICPVWCLAWIWINSKDPSVQIRARRSIFLSIVSFLGLIILTVVLTASTQKTVRSIHCPTRKGLLVTMKFGGKDADPARFLGDYANQLKFKVVLFSLLSPYISDKSLRPEGAIIIDEFRALADQQRGESLLIIFRVITRDIVEANSLIPVLSDITESRKLVDDLAVSNIDFAIGFLSSFQPEFTKRDTEVGPLLPFEQTVVQVIPGRRDVWSSAPSQPSLMMQPPMGGSIADPANQEWAIHNQTQLATCWWVGVYSVPADECLDSASVSCKLGGAEDRVVQVKVFANSTSDMFNVFVRQHDGDLGVVSSAPQPTWLMDPVESSQVPPSKDLARCDEVNDISSCGIGYNFKVARGPHKSYLWIGVVGKSPLSRWVPFYVRTRHVYGDPFASASNPFADVDGGASLAAPASLLSTLLLALLATALGRASPR